MGRQGDASAYQRVNLSIYDLSGRLVRTLVDEAKQPGLCTVTWDAAGLPSGIYFLKLTSGQLLVARKAILLR